MKRITFELLDDLGLNPYEHRLLSHYLAVGHCNETVRELSKKCQISIGKVSETRRFLADSSFLVQFGVFDSFSDRSGYVYIFRNDDGFYKVGKSSDPSKRLQSLKTASPIPIKTVKVFSTGDMDALEADIHEALSDYHVKGEWFRLNDKLVETITEMVEGVDHAII